MGRFERKAARKKQGASTGMLDGLPGKQVLAAKVEYNSSDPEKPPTIHTTIECSGQELVMSLGIICADWLKAMKQANPEADMDLGLELCVLLAQVQMGAAATLDAAAKS